MHIHFVEKKFADNKTKQLYDLPLQQTEYYE